MSNKKGWIGEETYGMSTLGLGEFKINGPEEEIKELLKAIREETPELLTKEQIEN